MISSSAAPGLRNSEINPVWLVVCFLLRLAATRYENGFAVISFEDTGTGIRDKIKEKIFDPFFTTTDRYQYDIGGPGSGLGLKIVSDIAGSYGGYVRVEEPHKHYRARLDFAVPAVQTRN